MPTTSDVAATVDTDRSFPRRVSLRSALQLDAGVSGANGAAYLLAAGPLGDLLGLSAPLLRVLGLVLIAFSALVWLTATHRGSAGTRRSAPCTTSSPAIRAASSFRDRI